MAMAGVQPPLSFAPIHHDNFMQTQAYDEAVQILQWGLHDERKAWPVGPWRVVSGKENLKWWHTLIKAPPVFFILMNVHKYKINSGVAMHLPNVSGVWFIVQHEKYFEKYFSK